MKQFLCLTRDAVHVLGIKMTRNRFHLSVFKITKLISSLLIQDTLMFESTDEKNDKSQKCHYLCIQAYM